MEARTFGRPIPGKFGTSCSNLTAESVHHIVEGARTMSENPWHSLPAESPFFLPEDKDKLEAFNRKEEQKVGQNHRLNFELIPEAFIGRPDAPLVLLGNISGVSETGGPPAAYRLKQNFQNRMRSNLLHTHSGRPFVYFDPDITPPGEDWWERKLKCVLREIGNGDVAKSILAGNLLEVQFFPYVSWSSKYAHDSIQLSSQRYSFDLVRKAVKHEAVIVLPNGERRGLGHEAVIVIRHGERRWLKAAPELDGYHRLVRLKEVRKGIISPGNCRENGWSLIQEVIHKITANTP